MLVVISLTAPHPNPKDLAAVIRWVEETKLASDIAMVSIHAHEHASEKMNQPISSSSLHMR